MNRTLTFLSSAALLTMAAKAQCFESDFGTQILFNQDDALSATVTMNINFPMGGVFATYDQIAVNSNGAAFLWNSTGGAIVGATATGYGTVLASLQGTAGGGPRIAPYYRDLDTVDVFVNTSFPGKTVITWANCTDWNAGGTPFTMQAQLFASGEVDFVYDGNIAQLSTIGLAGISQGGGIADPGVTDLSVAAVGTSTSPIVYETYPTVGGFDLQNTALLFIPNVGGGFDSVPIAGPTANCVHASHETLGVGCYNISDSHYQLFADAAVASAALSGQSFTFTPNAGSYLMTNGGPAYAPPGGGATNLFATATDDGEIVLTPSTPLAVTPQGPQASLRVHSNGILTWGATATDFPGTFNYQPTANAFLTSNNGGIYVWHDFNEAETAPAASARIKKEEVVVGPDTILILTWPLVENYSDPAATNPTEMQVRVNLTTGVITVAFGTVDANTTSIYGTAYLVGYSAPGTASVDALSQNLATSLPHQIATVNSPAMSLSAAPIPIINPSTVVTYTVNNVPEFQPASGIYLSDLFLSVNPLPGGFDVFGLLTGTPGCSAYIVTLDVDLGAQVTLAPTATWNLTFDNVTFAPGNVIGAQAVSLYNGAFPLPNGEAGGFILSNGVMSTTQPF